VFLVGRIVKWLGEARALMFGLLISILSFVLYGLATEPWMFYIIPFFGGLSFVAQPAAQAIVAHTIKPNEQGAVQGSLTGIIALTGIVGPLLATNIFRFFISPESPVILPGAPFFVGAIFFVLGLLVAARTFATHRYQPPTMESSGMAKGE
jgi:DHA1 family tetracycline resistance protein-like MFS transporter